MTDRIVVAGDAHLGAENADAAAFDAFLDARYREREELAALVLLGDVWDMIRRDSFGCAWETSETITRIKDLADEIPVYFVYGNHDTHLRHLDATLYEVEFRDELVLESGDARVRFRHGKSFDKLQFDPLSELLSGPGDRGDIDPTKGLKDPVVATGRDLLQRQKRRLRGAYDAVRANSADTDSVGTDSADTDSADTDSASDRPDSGAAESYPRRERRAHDFLAAIPEEKLVYGHTHSPYVRADNAAANPGSWKTTAPVHNTYLELADGDLSLYRHRTDGTDELLGGTDELLGDAALSDERAETDASGDGTTSEDATTSLTGDD
jgi:UDP-2,3-diacylglucosamine pyrophosphatase LpxH